MSDSYEEYNYSEHGKKDRKHGSKKESAQHKEPSTSGEHTRKIGEALRNEEKNSQKPVIKH